MNIDKAGRVYWDDVWTETNRVSRPGSVKHLEKRFHHWLSDVFRDFDTRGARLLEAGCGASLTLPYLAKEFGFAITGIDYSPVACDAARRSLEQQHVTGEIVCADLFQPPEELNESFDVVLSSGLIEHFSETSVCIRSLARFLRPGGLMINSIPNLTGVCGSLQKALNRPVFDVHVPLDENALRTAHEAAGLEVVACEYFMSTNFGVVNLHGMKKDSVTAFTKRVALAMLTRLSHAVWIAEDVLRPIPPNRFTSPYVHCVSRKPVH